MAYRNRSPGVSATCAATGETLARWKNAPVASLAGRKRVLNVPPDVFDLRDRQYQPTLEPLPGRVDQRKRISAQRIRDQGDEGSCTGFAMAAVVNHLKAARKEVFDASPRFLYENARRYDEWKGEEYEGSSIRGAMKGFHKHGVCSWRDLPYEPGQVYSRLPPKAVDAALGGPLGAYFRVSTSSINDLQSALAEVGAVLVSAQVHRGWDRPRKGSDGLVRIAWRKGNEPQGGHAFALVGYTADGFIVQNSWGTDWGSGGFALLGYDDWLVNRMDAWVCQLGVGRVQREVARAGAELISAREERVDEREIRGHYLAIRNGCFDDQSPFRSGPQDLVEIAQRVVAFAKKHASGSSRPAPILLYAHGGLVKEGPAALRALALQRQSEAEGVYPISFIWHTGFAETLGDLLLPQRARVGPVAGEERVQGWLREKLAEAKDEAIELALRLGGRPVWAEMKGDAAEACHGPGTTERDADAGAGSGDGPAFAMLDAIHTALLAAKLRASWHLVGHSAGSIFHCRLFEWFVRRQIKLGSISFLAPAVSCSLFLRSIAANEALVGRFGLHTMPDEDERDDDCARLYGKSLLYLVSGSFETEDERQLLGLDRDVRRDHRGSRRSVDPAAARWLASAKVELDFRRPSKTDSTLHGSWDDDPATLRAVFARVRR